jgi:flagellin
MGFRINTNIAAMTAHSNSVMNNRNLDDSLSKLSSGLRINKAADDASGLVIANSLRSQASSLGQAVSNGNDAIGLIQTADGALNEYSRILDTIKTKSVQAASDGQNPASRLAIQKDIGRLMEELNMIAKTTSFNGQKLLSGTFTNKEFQMGASANETVKASIASAETSQIGQTTQARLDISGEGQNQLTIISGRTGESITLEPIDVQYNNKAANGMGAVADQLNKYSAETGVTAKAVVSVTTGTIAAGTTGTDFKINGIQIGQINVSATDKDGTLLNAINKKTAETGVTATKNQDGTLVLSSTDGRAIQTSGDIAVIGATTDEMSTLGYLEVTQVGSSTFQIKGLSTAAAVGADITSSSSMTTIKDSLLAISSTIASSSTIAAGSTLGFDYTMTSASQMSANSSTADSLIVVGSTLGSGTKINKDTVLTSKIITDSSAVVVLSSDMFIKAGSILGSASKLDAGTVLQQDMTVSGTLYKAGATLTVDLQLTATITLSKDMTMHVDAANPNATLSSGSTLLAGTILGQDIITTGSSVLGSDMTLKAGSALTSGAIVKAGSVLGENLTTTGSVTTTAETELKTGSILVTGAVLKEGSTIGGNIGLNAAVTLNQDMVVKAGSTLKSGTVLKAGTLLTQDLTDAQIGNGTGVGLAKGTVLGQDITTTADITIAPGSDMTLLKGTGTAGSIAAGSTLVTNTEAQSSDVTTGDATFSNLSEINVTTLQGAMRAISTLDAAMTDLDTIRSDLGSVQNQLVSTINNISVTQVNVKAAESQIRDVDFAAESANFSKYNILAQSGSYAMSQANAVQQNVLKLLQ